MNNFAIFCHFCENREVLNLSSFVIFDKQNQIFISPFPSRTISGTPEETSITVEAVLPPQPPSMMMSTLFCHSLKMISGSVV